ncbi:hypothetical protein [Falsiroseomonas sp. CW058]|uniref:hypothetical protein n=1 Tax=Falsiroseomonas sp. CW058 TaxID=3388664 RepID=UPI003D314BF9
MAERERIAREMLAADSLRARLAQRFKAHALGPKGLPSIGRELAYGVADIRQKVVEEGWFGRVVTPQPVGIERSALYGPPMDSGDPIARAQGIEDAQAHFSAAGERAEGQPPEEFKASFREVYAGWAQQAEGVHPGYRDAFQREYLSLYRSWLNGAKDGQAHATERAGTGWDKEQAKAAFRERCKETVPPAPTRERGPEGPAERDR